MAVASAVTVAATSTLLTPAQPTPRTGVLVGNGTTTADVHYVCLLAAAGTYSWKQLSAG